MAEQILDQIRHVADGHIDFEGQSLAETLSTWSLTIAGVIAFLIGYLLQDIKLTVYIGLAGTAATFIFVLPPWPFYNKHPLKWLPVGGAATDVPQTLVVDEKYVR